MLRQILNKGIQIIGFLFLIYSCKNDQKESDLKTIPLNESKPEENLLIIGRDTLKLKALYDTVTCVMAYSQDRTGQVGSNLTGSQPLYLSNTTLLK